MRVLIDHGEGVFPRYHESEAKSLIINVTGVEAGEYQLELTAEQTEATMALNIVLEYPDGERQKFESIVLERV